MKLLHLCLMLVPLVAVRADDAPLDRKASSIQFTGHAFLHDFTGDCQALDGKAEIDLKAPQIVTSAKLIIAVTKMTTHEPTRDKNMESWLDAKTDPLVVFTLTKVRPFASELSVATEKMPARFSIEGELLIHGRRQPIKNMADAWRVGSTLIVSGTATVNTEDYGLPTVRLLLLSVDKTVDISYHLVFDLPPAPAVAVGKPNHP